MNQRQVAAEIEAILSIMSNMSNINEIYKSFNPKEISKIEYLGAIKLIYLQNVIILENINPKNINIIYKEFKEAFRSGRAVLEPAYIYNGKPYMAIMSRAEWEDKDYFKGMRDYYGSGQYWKDIAKISDNINIVDTTYNSIMSPLDKIFKTKADSLKDKNIRCFLYALYGYVRTKILISILSICKPVGAVAGGLYLASFACNIIFDFRGIIDFFKQASAEEICFFLGSFAAIGASIKNIKQKFSGKKISIEKSGKLKVENIKGDIKKTIAEDTKPNYIEKRIEGLKKFKDKRFARAIKQKMPSEQLRQMQRKFKKDIGIINKKELKARFDELLKTNQFRKGLENKLKTMSPKDQRQFLEKYYKRADTINKKFEIAYYARQLGFYDMAVKYYNELKNMLSANNPAAFSKNFWVDCWADLYYSLYNIATKVIRYTNDFSAVKNAINRLVPEFKTEIESKLKSYYKMKESEIKF